MVSGWGSQASTARRLKHDQSCSVSRETTDVTVTRGMLWSDSVITLAFLHEFVYEFRGNNTYIILDRTALPSHRELKIRWSYR